MTRGAELGTVTTLTMTSKMSSKYFKMYLDMTRTQGYQREKNDKNVKK